MTMVSRGVTTVPADPALQGATDPGDPSRLPENIFFTARLFQTFYGLALLRIEEFVGT